MSSGGLAGPSGRSGGTGRRVAVVGSGASGMTAALRLHQAGHDVDLVERDEVLGGRFGVGRLGDRPVMTGGKNIGRRYDTFRAFTAALGADSYQDFGYNASRVKDGQVLTLDSTRRSQTLRAVQQMGAPRDLARLAALAVRIRLDPTNRYLGSRYFTQVSRRHDHRPLSAFFGAELTANLVRPMVLRNNGAEPDEVFPGTFGTNLAMLLDHYDQLEGGIQPVLDAMAERVRIRTRCTVQGLRTRDGSVTGLRVTQDGGPTRTLDYDGVVLATNAHAAAQVLGEVLATTSERLAQVRYFPSTVVLVEYDRPVFTEQVRALVLDDGPCSNAGSYGKHERHIVRYTYSGRRGRRGHPTPDRVDELTGETEARLSRYLGTPRAERVRTLVRHWDAAYCGYLPYHADFLRRVREDVAGVGGLELAGDYLQGVSIEGCARSGRAAGSRLAAHLGGAAA